MRKQDDMQHDMEDHSYNRQRYYKKSTQQRQDIDEKIKKFKRNK